MTQRARWIGAVCGLALAGCEQAIIKDSDRQVYTLIARRQIDALGQAHDARIGVETGQTRGSGTPYAFVPHPVDPGIPDAFKARPASPEPVPAEPQPAEGSSSSEAEDDAPGKPNPVSAPEPPSGDDAATKTDGGPSSSPPAADDLQESSNSIAAAAPPPEPPVPPESRPPEPAPFEPFEPEQSTGLGETVAYAMQHARELQTAKEDLYLAALDLTLERHLWTPQLSAALSAEFADYGQVRDFDRAMTTVSEVAVQQRLPLGGQVTARLLNSLMRDLGAHVTSGETGQFIMDANIPLFRGAGHVAYESRYAAERALIYAVRSYERFRRQFLVQIASAYFDLQQNQSQIFNAEATRGALWLSYQRALSFQEHERMALFEVTRVESSFRAAESNVQDALERYESAKDQFKILLGMPVEEAFDVVPQGEDPLGDVIERLLPEVAEAEAIDVALRYRLDLLTELDRIDDARRGVSIARNGLLPDLNLTGSMTMSTDPDQKNSLSYNSERTTWRGMIEMRLDDRKTERNAYRESLVNLRRAERDHEQFAESVRADVRRALRRIDQARANREIQRISVRANEERYSGAEELNKKGRATNQDLVDAQNELLDARNRLAAAQAQYYAAILEFRLATDTLRIADDGALEIETGASPEGEDPSGP